MVRGIENASISNISVTIGATLGYISAKNCYVKIYNSDINTVAMPSKATTVNNANMFTIDKAATFEINDMYIYNIDVEGMTFETFLYSAYSDLTLNLIDTTVMCRDNFNLS